MSVGAEQSPELHQGTLIEANNNTSSGTISETQEGDFPLGYVFTFDQIGGYKDQTMREMGLLPGREIQFTVDPTKRRIQSVQFTFVDGYKRVLGVKLPFQDYLDGF